MFTIGIQVPHLVMSIMYASPNYLWHIDGLHCLIRWKIVIHGGIDGFSRRIVYLHSSCNNRAETVLHLFHSAVRMFGWPLRVRSDKGGENVEVARAMILARGTGRKSFITGSSVHNQRIERLWRDTFRCVCHSYYAVFYNMEECGLLDPDSDEDVFALQFVFIPRINSQLHQFVDTWNRGILSATPQIQEEIAEGLAIDADYGVEIGEQSHTNIFDSESVVVAEIDVGLGYQQLEYIYNDHFNLLQRSDLQCTC